MTTRATTAGEVVATPSIDQVQAKRRFWIIVSLLIVYIIWGTTYLGIRYALESYPPYFMMGIRFSVAGGGLLAFLAVRGATMPTLKQWRNASIVGLLLFVGGMGSVAIAEQSISSGLAAMLVATSPLWTMMFSIFWGNRPTRFEWIGVALGIVGVGLLTLEDNLQANPGSLALMIFAPVCWALGSVLSKHLEMPKGAMGNAAEMLPGGLALLVLGVLRGEQIAASPTSNATIWLIYLTIFGSLVTMSAYMYLLKTVSPSLATSYAFVNPAIALILGVMIAGEHITHNALFALPAILIAVGFVAFSKKPAPRTEDQH